MYVINKCGNNDMLRKQIEFAVDVVDLNSTGGLK